MDSYEDDEDTHFCIKCHSTLTGLDNYVRHRQTGCRQSAPKNDVIYPEILNADTFFSSLQLRSSVKSESVDVDEKPRSDDKRIEKGIEKEPDADESLSKDKLITLSPVVGDLEDPTDHIGIPSLVGFPDFVSFTEKTSIPKDPPIKTEIEKREGDWLNDDLEDLETARVSPNPLDYNPDYDYDESDVDSPDEEDSYSESDDERGYARQSLYSGGKWKPGQILQEMEKINDDDDDAEEYGQDSPSHTGGKWKPTEPQKADEDEPSGSQQLDDDEDDEDEDRDGRRPPPGHTHGKWIPGGSVELTTANSSFWCIPCGRRLASKLLYDRHLRSDLHARRSIQEIEGVHIMLPKDIGPVLRPRSKRQRALALKTIDSERKSSSINNKREKRQREREKLVIRCEMCHARVRRSQLGKHLLSHYHCRVAGLNPSSGTAEYRFILDNMDNVVRQCPFQCTSCKFYCNTHETFLLHWRSELHNSVKYDENSILTCTNCNFFCSTNKSMEHHLMSIEHSETIAMMNGSVPIIIRRQRLLTCDTCTRSFRYNLQLRIHSRESNHPLSTTANDGYQSRISCCECNKVFRSLVALQRHQLTSHRSDMAKGQTTQAPYFCSFCSINFVTAQDAVQHRRTASHKQIVKETKFQGVDENLLQRNCEHCGERLKNLRKLKAHLLQHHYDLCHKCTLCGNVFPLKQNLARHTRIGDCTIKLETDSRPPKKWNCDNCSVFSTDSHAELIFHQILHAGPVENDPNTPTTSNKSSPKYRCQLCDKILPKDSMKNHVRRHTGERPFSCPNCTKSFYIQSNLKTHTKHCTSNNQESDGQNNFNKRERKYICLECKEAFYTKQTLRQHVLRHTGKSYKCGMPGCPTILRTECELRHHRKRVHEPGNRLYKCSQCEYSTKIDSNLRRHQEKHKTPANQIQFPCPYRDCRFTTTILSHLKRHYRIHTGDKPFKCRYCTYACNNLENLRKHVLSTRLHPGTTIYECETCTTSGSSNYGTNFSKELKAHLMEAHPNIFPTAKHAADYISNIFYGN